MVHFKFFKGPNTSTPIFNKKLEEAIELIKKNKSLIAIKVLEVINANKISIYPFSDMTEKRYFGLVEGGILDLPQEYPPTTAAVQKIENAYGGMIYGNDIYISFSYSPSMIASTLIHEVSHYLNDELNKEDFLKMPKTVANYLDEVRSFIAERIFEKNGHCMLRSDVKKIHGFVPNLYPHLTKPEDTSAQGYIYGHFDLPAP